ncbi:MAG: class I SAM-dependent methyltransferase [Candidatus Marinimicrobia bacterium]|nr:class I SAM-dependent methyltransferase [Candidatus Neomarinimicrobiota bacterium]
MKIETEAQNHFYDGWIYRKILDPSLGSIRKRVSRLITENATVLDVGCGTGDQLFFLSNQIQSGLGVELSGTMIKTCEEQALARGIKNCDFLLADASNLSSLKDNSFDYAVTSLVIHEMPEAIRIPVLTEMTRLGKQLIIVDWIYPQPSMIKKISTHFVERLAGREHYAGFKSFIKQGGMPALINRLGLEIIETQITGKGNMQLWVCKTP